MVELWCGMLGHGHTFPVTIRLDEQIRTLKTKILDAVRNEIYPTVTLGDLQVYDARISSPSGFTRAIPTRGCEPTWTCRVARLSAIERIAHSGFTIDSGERLVRQLSIGLDDATAFPVDIPRTTQVVDIFQWRSVLVAGQVIPLREDQHAGWYHEFFEKCLKDVLLSEGLCVVGVEAAANFLHVRIGNTMLTGRTDMIVLPERARTRISSDYNCDGVRMAVEVKKQVQRKDAFQAITELIALDLLTEDRVIVVLTDLMHDWQFFWVDNVTQTRALIKKFTINRCSEAIDAIRALLAANDQSFRAPADIARHKLTRLFRTTDDPRIFQYTNAWYHIVATFWAPNCGLARSLTNQRNRSFLSVQFHDEESKDVHVLGLHSRVTSRAIARNEQVASTIVHASKRGTIQTVGAPFDQWSLEQHSSLQYHVVLSIWKSSLVFSEFLDSWCPRVALCCMSSDTSATVKRSVRTL